MSKISDLQGLMLFAFLDRLIEMRGAFLWHQAKGMRPAMVPAIPPSVAMHSLRDAAQTMNVTPEALDTMLDEFQRLCLSSKPSERHADNIAAKVAIVRSVTEGRNHDALEVHREDAKLDELREAARNLVSILVASGGGRECSTCYALATVADPLPRGGSVFRCEKHARAPSVEWEDDPQRSFPTDAAAALRRLRALVG